MEPVTWALTSALVNPSSVPIHSPKIGTSFCSTCTTSTSGEPPGCAPDACFGRKAPTITLRTAKDSTPAIQRLRFEILFMCSSDSETFPWNRDLLFSPRAELNNKLMLDQTKSVQPSFKAGEGVQATYTASAGKRLAARTPRTMKINMTTTCVPRNGGTDCVRARALRAGIFMKNSKHRQTCTHEMPPKFCIMLLPSGYTPSSRVRYICHRFITRPTKHEARRQIHVYAGV